MFFDVLFTQMKVIFLTFRSNILLQKNAMKFISLNTYPTAYQFCHGLQQHYTIFADANWNNNTTSSLLLTKL